MKLFVDTAEITEIEQANSWGVLDGVTTNPSLLKQAVESRTKAGESVDIESYLERYFGGTIAHYNPRGNFFHAFAIKDKVVEMLEPKPIPYLGYA